VPRNPRPSPAMPRKRGWGSGEVYQEPSGKWAVRWRENGRRRYRGGFGSKALADRVLAKIRGDMAAQRAGLPPDPRDVPYLGELAIDFLERRKATHRAAAEDGYRWRKHMAPSFAHLRPDEVDHARIRAFVEAKRREISPGTVRICIALLSSLYGDLLERRLATANPARGLPKSVLRLIKPTHDPRTTPFLERLEDVRRVHLALPKPLHVAYAIGALAGLRTGEVFALRWIHVDLAARRIHVRESVKGPLKDKDSRVVPVLDSLHPILAAWHLETGGTGRVIPPMRCDGKKIDKNTPGIHLRDALRVLGLPDLEPKPWYSATRHTFASQWVMAGGAIEKLKEILGHYSVVVTERYAHLKPEHFTARDLGTIAVDLAPGRAVPLENSQWMASATDKPAARSRNRTQKAGAVL
jgi:integrase